MLFQIAHAQDCEPTNTTRCLDNPIGAFSSIPDMLSAIVNILLVIAVPIVVFFIIYAGFTYVMARGNPEKVRQASQSLLYGVIGVVIVFGAFAISAIVQSLVNAF